MVHTLKQFRQPPANRRTKAQWSGAVALLEVGSATGTGFWVDEDQVTVVNI